MTSTLGRGVQRPISADVLIRRPWFQTLAAGIVIWSLLDWATLASKNINLVPSLIVVGASLGPIAFTAYVYERDRDVPPHLLLWCFIVGGALGVTAASVLEYRTILGLGALPTLAIGLIEETCKLIVPVAIFLIARQRREIDGLLFGVASGLGFAAFESMGYGLTALLLSNGDIGHVEQLLFVRTVLSPAGHGAWTGLVCAMLWRARERPSPQATATVPLAFVTVVLLHATWDAANHPWVQAIVATISLTLLFWRIDAATRRRALPAREAAPANAPRIASPPPAERGL
jgi:RsiW-degrading membrane proteinase PrsW (M82 family)